MKYQGTSAWSNPAIRKKQMLFGGNSLRTFLPLWLSWQRLSWCIVLMTIQQHLCRANSWKLTDLSLHEGPCLMKAGTRCILIFCAAENLLVCCGCRWCWNLLLYSESMIYTAADRSSHCGVCYVEDWFWMFFRQSDWQIFSVMIRSVFPVFQSLLTESCVLMRLH